MFFFLFPNTDAEILRHSEANEHQLENADKTGAHRLSRLSYKNMKMQCFMYE